MGYKSPGSYAVTIGHSTYDPADSTTYLFGSALGNPPETITGKRIIKFPVGGIIKRCVSVMICNVVSSNENISLYIRKNDTTDYLVDTVGNVTAAKIFDNLAMNIPIAIGDYVELKIVTPAWATNPTGVLSSGSIYIEIE